MNLREMTTAQRIQWAMEKQPQASSAPPQNRPGDVLHNLLRSRYGVTIASCKCQEWIDRMNAGRQTGAEITLKKSLTICFEEASTNENVSTAIRMALKVPIVGKLEGKRTTQKSGQRSNHNGRVCTA
jgi:hypothetical protein